MMKRTVIWVICLLVAAPAIARDFYDPMQPPAYALYKMRLEQQQDASAASATKATQEKAPVWVLNSILYSAQRRHAIINNQLVRQGDTVDGAKLVRLQRDSVRLIAKSRVIDLQLSARNAPIKKISKENKL